MRFRMLVCMLALLLIVTACAVPRESRPAADPCCSGGEIFPGGLIAALDPLAPLLGGAVALVNFRPGYIGILPDARDRIASELRPLDILLVSSKGRLSGYAIPGLFGHAVVYIGTGEQLSDAGLWSAVTGDDDRSAISRGRIFLEADRKGVHLSTAATALQTDRVLILRMSQVSAGRKKQILAAFLGSIGTPFDFRFDADTPECVFCTELVHRMLPELQLQKHRLYDRSIVFPDEIARSALDGNPRLRPRLYIVGEPGGWHVATMAQARADIDAWWARNSMRRP